MSIIEVPDELAQEIDRLAGTNTRSSYVIDVLWRQVRAARQREALPASAGVWKPEDHPELALGGAAHVHTIRAERDERMEQSLHRQAD